MTINLRDRGTVSAVSYIVSVPQPVSSSFACHVSCKVKYYWKVANVKVRFRGRDNVLSFSQLCCSMSPTNQFTGISYGSLWITNTIDEILSRGDK